MAVTFSGKFNTSGRTSIGPTGAVTTDPYWNNVTFLLNYTNGYADASPAPKALQAQGTTAARSNVGGVFPAGSDQWHGVFNGARTSVLQYDNSSNAFNFGTRSFTIDGWINPTVYQSGQYMVLMGTYQWSDVHLGYLGGWNVGINLTTKKLQANFKYPGAIVVSSQIIPLNTWTHFAVTRSGTIGKLYINGALSSTITNVPTTMPDVGSTYYPNRLRVGAYVGNDGILETPFNGRMDELRITDGIVRYTDNFIPPTAPYPVTA